jgi:hypothetical protein
MKDEVSSWFILGSSFTKLSNGLTLLHISSKKIKSRKRRGNDQSTIDIQEGETSGGLGMRSPRPQERSFRRKT